MGLAFLPWERLPAYILGPLISSFCIWSLFWEPKPSLGGWLFGIGGAVIGLWLVWYRFSTGKEPLAFTHPKEQRAEDGRKQNE